MSVNAINSTVADAPNLNSATEFSALGSDDFLKLLITQLTNQDPLEPTGNEELLQQISSIRDIELSTTLTDSLRSLTGQQRFASASTLIGQHVTSTKTDSEESRSGTVIGVRFDENGQAMLQLAGGEEIALDQVESIQTPLQAAEALVGRKVVGFDRQDGATPEIVEGLVAEVRQDDSGEVILELDTGKKLRFRDVVQVTGADV